MLKHSVPHFPPNSEGIVCCVSMPRFASIPEPKIKYFISSSRTATLSAPAPRLLFRDVVSQLPYRTYMNISFINIIYNYIFSTNICNYIARFPYTIYSINQINPDCGGKAS